MWIFKKTPVEYKGDVKNADIYSASNNNPVNDFIYSKSFLNTSTRYSHTGVVKQHTWSYLLCDSEAVTLRSPFSQWYRKDAHGIPNVRNALSSLGLLHCTEQRTTLGLAEQQTKAFRTHRIRRRCTVITSDKTNETGKMV